jgi:hypothetical protein
VENKSKKITTKKIIKTTFNVLFPFKSIKNSTNLFINTTRNNIKTANNIKNMVSDLYESTKIETKGNDTFESAVENSGLTVDELILLFKRKKNIYLAALYFFCTLAIASIIYSFAVTSSNNFLFSYISLFACFSIFFLLSFGTQFRLWQLKVRRLSTEEKGGIRNFMKESNWFFSSLKFEHKHNIEGKNEDEKFN